MPRTLSLIPPTPQSRLANTPRPPPATVRLTQTPSTTTTERCAQVSASDPSSLKQITVDYDPSVLKQLKRLFSGAKMPKQACACTLLLGKFQQLGRLAIGKKEADKAKCLVKAKYIKVNSQICLEMLLDIQVPKDVDRFTRVTLIIAFRDGEGELIPIEDTPVIKEPLTMKVSQERTKGGSISFQATMTGPAAGAEYNMGNKHGHEMNGVPVIEGSSQVDNHKVRWILEEAHDVTYGVRDTWTLPIRMNMNITNNPTLPLSAEFRLECRSPAMFPSLGMSPRTYSLPNSSDESLSLLELSLVDDAGRGEVKQTDDEDHRHYVDYEPETDLVTL